MSDSKPSRVLVRRPSKVRTDGRGRSVWADAIETAQLELVSTGELKQILAATDNDDRTAIEKAVETSEDGVLARDPATGMFEVIEDDDLREILDNDSGLPAVTRPSDVTLEPLQENADAAADELSLVSTQMLRKVLGKPELEIETEEPLPTAEQGFNPYDNS